MVIDTSRLKIEDYILLPGSLLLLGSIFLGWYSLGVGYVSGWDSTRWSIALMVCALAGVLVVLLTAMGIDFTEEYGFALCFLGLGSTAVGVTKIFVRQTGLSAAYGIFISIAGAVCLLFAGLAKLVRTNVIYIK